MSISTSRCRLTWCASSIRDDNMQMRTLSTCLYPKNRRTVCLQAYCFHGCRGWQVIVLGRSVTVGRRPSFIRRSGDQQAQSKHKASTGENSYSWEGVSGPEHAEHAGHEPLPPQRRNREGEATDKKYVDLSSICRVPALLACLSGHPGGDLIVRSMRAACISGIHVLAGVSGGGRAPSSRTGAQTLAKSIVSCLYPTSRTASGNADRTSCASRPRWRVASR